MDRGNDSILPLGQWMHPRREVSISSGKDKDSGIVIPINISIAENGEYNAYSPDNTMPPRHNAPLIAEWTGVKTLSHTRTKESPEYSGPRIASMELTEDTLSTLTTRANNLSTGVYFRLIVFRKSGSNYVFQSAADYTSMVLPRLC